MKMKKKPKKEDDKPDGRPIHDDEPEADDRPIGRPVHDEESDVNDLEGGSFFHRWNE